MSGILTQIERQLRGVGNSKRAKLSLQYFRTGPGEYGEGDLFLGLTVPQIRTLARQHALLPLPQVAQLLASRWHEVRLLALFILVRAFDRGDAAQRLRVAKLYLANLKRVNNWDLVDSSAHLILGPHLETRKRSVLDTLSRSPNLWRRRIAMLTTLHFIRQQEFDDALRIARRLLHDDHDLIHKAVGWMLREIGQRDLPTLLAFLDQHHAVMPRTMLRYAIEQLAPKARQHYMQKKADK